MATTTITGGAGATTITLGGPSGRDGGTFALDSQAVADRIRAVGDSVYPLRDDLSGFATSAQLAQEIAATNAALATLASSPGFAGSLPVLAANPSGMFSGSVVRNFAGAVKTANVTWPDGSPGKYTATVASRFPDRSSDYTVTYEPTSGQKLVFTQPPVTFDAAGQVVNRPTITQANYTPPDANLRWLFDANLLSGNDGDTLSSWSPAPGSLETTPMAIAIAAYYPTLMRAGIKTGQDAVGFTASAQSRLLTGVLPTVRPAPLTRISVFKPSSASAVTYLFFGANPNGNTTAGSLNLTFNSTTLTMTATGNSAATITAPFTAQGLHVAIEVYDGANSRLYLDGAAAVTGALSTDASLKQFGVGRLSGAGSAFGGRVAYLEIRDEAMTDAAATAKMNALLGRYSS